MSATGCVLVMTTLPTDADAPAFARALVDVRLAACVNLLPEMRSVYRWDDAVQEDGERQVLIKTTAARVPALMDRIRDLHPYDTPELIVLPIEEGSDRYLTWIRASTAS